MGTMDRSKQLVVRLSNYLDPNTDTETIGRNKQNRNIVNKETEADSWDEDMVNGAWENSNWYEEGKEAGGEDCEDADANKEIKKSVNVENDDKLADQESDEKSENVDDDCDLDYEPEKEFESEDESESDIEIDNADASKKSLRTSDENRNLSNISINLSSAPDEETLYVAESRGKRGGQKFNFCQYCHTKQMKLARHLQNKHEVESEVQKFICLPKGVKERREIIAAIRKKGNFIFNTKKEYNDGELIVARRPNKKYCRTAKEFAACGNCKAFFSKRSLRVHFKTCSGMDSRKSRKVMVFSKAVMGRIHPVASEVTRRKLFPPLREDYVVKHIRYDELIIIYANKMCRKYSDERHFEMIRQRMRLLGRFMISLKNINTEITALSSIYDPKFCDDVQKAIDIVAKLNSETGHYANPSVAFNLGSLIKTIGVYYANECIKSHMNEKQINADNFLKLFKQEIGITVNRTVTESQLQKQRRKIIELPCTEDIKIMHKYLSFKRNEALTELQSNFRFEMWMQLAETTLLTIQIFNRRRAGEMERCFIEDFASYQSINENTHKELFQSITDRNKQLAKKYVRFEIRGKLNRTVGVLLDVHLVDCIKILLQYRKNANISSKNPYIFGLPGSRKKYLRSCNLMRKYSLECGAEHPERLRGTELRKHMATTCISLNLAEQEVSDLANFMGHANKIHCDIYRQPMSRDILRMSRLLEAAQGEQNYNEEESLDNDNASVSESEGKKSIYSIESSIDESEKSSGLQETRKTRSNGYMEYQLNKKKKKRSTSPFGSVRRVRWTEEEKTTGLKVFKNNIKDMKLPSFKQIQKVVDENPLLKGRTLPQIKTWIHNQFKNKLT